MTKVSRVLMENKNLVTKGARRKRSNRGEILFIIEILMGMTQQRRELVKIEGRH